jgi:Protein tyrosine/serine phosphatase
MNKNINLYGAKNIRDFGGIVNKDGKTIKQYCFLRGDALSRLKSKDVDILTKQYRLGQVIDLRMDNEIKEKPDVKIDGVQYHHFSILSESLVGISHEKEIDKNKLFSALPDMCQLYRSIVRERHSIDQMKNIFSYILNADDNTSVLWHCTEGKDRCGITSALFLYMLDVDMDTIFEDYLQTNIVSSKKASKYYWLVLLTSRNKEKANSIRNIFTADRTYLEAAFDEICKNCGDLDVFIETQLGISTMDRERLKNKCFESQSLMNLEM